MTKAQVFGVELRTSASYAHGVELSLRAEKRQEVKKRFADSPITLVGTASAECMDWPVPEKLKAAIEAAKAHLKLSRDVGASGVRVFPNQWHPNSDARDTRGKGFEANFNLVKNVLGHTLHVHNLKDPKFPNQTQIDLLVKMNWDGWGLLDASDSVPDRAPPSLSNANSGSRWWRRQFADRSVLASLRSGTAFALGPANQPQQAFQSLWGDAWKRLPGPRLPHNRLGLSERPYSPNTKAGTS